MAGRSSDALAAMIQAYPQKYDVDADSTQEAVDQVREKLDADQVVEEFWVIPQQDGWADVFDPNGQFLRRETAS